MILLVCVFSVWLVSIFFSNKNSKNISRSFLLGLGIIICGWEKISLERPDILEKEFMLIILLFGMILLSYLQVLNGSKK